MAIAGNNYTVTLKNAHLNWGEYRDSHTRPPISGEGYIPIPRDIAKMFHILNTNGTGKIDVWGQNIFHYKTSDGRQNGVLRAQGCSGYGDIYAKQFSADNDLKKIGTWFKDIGADVGTVINVEWVSPYDIILTKVN